MDQIMNKLHSLYIICLLILSTQVSANRPAEDDPVSSIPAIEETSSNVPAPVSAEPEMIPDAPPATDNSVSEQQSGDVIMMESESSTPQLIIVDFPRRGMDMSKVVNELGEPVTRHPAVGNPPITRWDYADRTVFFEYSHVIHVVAR